MSADILIAGIGNIFQSDDAFGVEVAKQLATKELPPSVQVADFGIRGIHLAFQLLDGYKTLILVDAVAMGEPPGTVAVIEPDLDGRSAGPADAHAMGPDAVLASIASVGAQVDRVLIVGCEPQTVEEGMGLSDAVAGAIETAVELCCHLAVDSIEMTPTRKESS